MLKLEHIFHWPKTLRVDHQSAYKTASFLTPSNTSLLVLMTLCNNPLPLSNFLLTHRIQQHWRNVNSVIRTQEIATSSLIVNCIGFSLTCFVEESCHVGESPWQGTEDGFQTTTSKECSSANNYISLKLVLLKSGLLMRLQLWHLHCSLWEILKQINCA